MAIQELDTTFKSVTDRMGPGAYYVVRAKAGASTDITYAAVPYKGKLVRALFCNGATAMSASHNYRVGIANASDSDAVMAASTVNGANDFGGTAYTDDFPAAYSTTEVTLTSTSADLAVDEGDTIEVTMTVEGTVTDANVLLYFEAIP